MPDPPDTIWTKQFADIRQGIPPRDLAFLGVFPCVADPSLAPPGKSSFLLWQFVPYNLADGGPDRWDDIKEEYADKIEAVMDRFVKNDMKKAVLKRFAYTPREIVRHNPSMVNGSFMHGCLGQDQSGIFRPFHEYPTGKSPIENLYLCGDSGGCGGQAGRSAAWWCLEDLKMKKWWED